MKTTLGQKLFTVVNYVVLTAAAFTMIAPLLQMLAVSLSSPVAADSKKVFLLPVEWTADSWIYILHRQDLWQSFGVTVFITVVGTLVSVLLSVLTAYPLAHAKFLIRKHVMFGIVITMIFNAPLIPFYMTVKSLGLLDSIWSLILPGAIGTFNMVIIRTFFMGIPSELEDSAQIDGCHDFRVLFQIYMPLSKPVLATVSLFYAVGYWNTFQRAILFIRDSDLHPLQVKLREYIMTPETLEVADMLGNIGYNTTTLKAATIIFAATPIILAYPFLQKYFVKGAMLGSLKE
ncbi:putative aldouronate transport system permease protein [Paenibacillus rhizosphaerae]|uniref:Putative aldouronate transport system permease protein n=1 Tax=Paenibacillus rhizosphaerae TaxID=297318 RepID=A0A839TJL6_9BACL|nr:carbohydrate ABC transporter permease [Paenibacillus rhizosphaerae]MBB3126861.1 putative aldouronate transport system permease protein [Paenibacillus rhizosphaerae]